MNETNRTIKNIVGVTLSNLCILVSGVFVSFIIPKVLGVLQYGYYKTFTLYANYIGILTFGISEGLYLKYSGTKYQDLNKEKIRTISLIFFAFEIIAAIFILFLAFFLTNENRIIFIFLSIYMLEMNLTTYYQYIAQMTLRFKDYSFRNIIRASLTILSCLIMVLIYFNNGKNSVSFIYYLYFTVGISTVLLLIYIFKFKDITFGKHENIASVKEDLLIFFKIGFPFLIANLCSTLILNIDRQFVLYLFETETYSIYAFAYNMISLITVCTSAISTVIFPSIKKKENLDIKEEYPQLVKIVLIFVAFMIISYFPLVLIVNWFLPQYSDSLIIFRIVLPGIAISSVITVVMQNFYKLLNKNTLFFIKNIFILILSVLLNILAYIIFKNTFAISIASIITIIIWYIVCEFYLIKNYKIAYQKNLIYALTILIGFYLITIINNIYFSCLCYLMFYCFITFIFYRDTCLSVIKKIFKRKKK